MIKIKVAIIIYIFIINIIAFIVYGIDKSKAKRKKWRISEATLLCLAFFGGAIGSFAAMKVFHHKTKKTRFAIGVPVMLIFQIVILFIIILENCFI